MSQSLRLHQVLDHLALLEQRAADLYAHLATQFRDNTEAAALFTIMKNEETNHKAQVMLQKRLANGLQHTASPVSIDLQGINSLIRAIDTQLAIKHTDLTAALDFALMLETNGMESAYRSVLTRQFKELEKLALALTSGDQQHVNKLLAFKEKSYRQAKL